MPVSFFSISEVYPPKLKTEEKRLHLTLENVDLYNRAIQEAGLLVPEGALYLVDLHHLTSGGQPWALSAPQISLSDAKALASDPPGAAVVHKSYSADATGSGLRPVRLNFVCSGETRVGRM